MLADEITIYLPSGLFFRQYHRLNRPSLGGKVRLKLENLIFSRWHAGQRGGFRRLGKRTGYYRAKWLTDWDDRRGPAIC